ncbi:MAG: HlyD family efflux transporter periplasmic adaptor subunit [Ignavibacteriae bacterium]|nr:MAG: HlyD family efflux transporter periplasmic adaptor subunit [Ignavibacteriota bacterium]
MKKILFSFLLFSIIISGCGEKKDPNRITASGTIEATNITISTKIAGQIKKLVVKEGDKVKKGDLLAEIDHDLLDIQLRQAEANVEGANAQLKLLLSGARKEDIRAAQDQLNQVKINLDQSKTDRDRMQALYETNTITKKQLDDAETRYEVNLSQYNAAKENLQKVKNIVRPEEIENARANVKRNIASADLLRQNIEDCRIFAPSDGIISKKFVEEGEIVSPSSSLLRLSDMETVNLVIYVNEVDLSKVKLGQKTEIKTDASKEKSYTGNIIFISPEAEFTPKNIQTQDERTKLVFAVKIEIPNQQYELKPGMPADAVIVF